MPIERQGFECFEHDPRVVRWVRAARGAADETVKDPEMRRLWMRHGATWFVGVDALPNDSDGSLGGVDLRGPWEREVSWSGAWHAGQLSITYAGYPKQDATESDASFAYRVKRRAAHVDGLLLEGGKRYLREPHAFVLGLPLNEASGCALTVWPGSHRIMGPALSAHLRGRDATRVDVTEVYKAARREVFQAIEPVEIVQAPGESVLLHRHTLHGIAPWKAGDSIGREGRMVAYFRPQFEDAREWLS